MSHYKIMKVLKQIAQATNEDDNEKLSTLYSTEESISLYSETDDFFNAAVNFHDSLFEVLSERHDLFRSTVVKVIANVWSDEPLKYTIKFSTPSEKLRVLNNIEIDAMFIHKDNNEYVVYCILMSRKTSKRFVKSFIVKNIEFSVDN